MKGWGKPTRGNSPLNRLASPITSSDVTGLMRFWIVIGIVAAFHTTFLVMLRRAIATNWIDMPAAIVLTLFHISLGSIVSVWLSRSVPRVLGAPMETRWLSVTTASFLFTIGVSAWLGYTAFEMIPTQLIGLKFGFIGLFLAVPCSIWFWQLGRTFSW